MHHAGYGSFPSIVDVCHGTCNGSGGRYAAKQRSSHVGNTLGYQFCVGVVLVTDYTVGHSGGEQRLDGTQYGDCDGDGEQILYCFPVQGRHHGFRQFGTDAETVADGIDAVDASIRLHQPDGYCHHDDGNERTRNLFREPGSNGDDKDTYDTYKCIPPVDCIEVLEINYPFSYKVSRNLLASERQSEDIGNLRGEDGDGDTACETYDDGIRDKLDDGSQLEHSQQDKQYACHQCGDNQPRFTILLDDAINDDDERTGRSSNLHLASSHQGDDETGYDSRNDTFLR